MLLTRLTNLVRDNVRSVGIYFDKTFDADAVTDFIHTLVAAAVENQCSLRWVWYTFTPVLSNQQL
jgi:hypothetical protein